ncbi:glutamate 5-kinase [Coniochaeta ligniaria NRRL 30616]|uniref:Glutamate 5-kinase n=1 Tax=Coniochaeta ligniaria NRRL 30616 TaxID=1408157 RepID=A0A1J7J3K0_9PEZI|nr:glutamate 5-kinase [Coniochaeta ligniaria NRRL 30616]
MEGTDSMKCNRSLGIVIKLGTSSIVDEKTHEPLLSTLTVIVETAVRLRKDGHKVVIVSSGAIGVGLRRMDVDKRPKHVSQLQALAAIGQCRLISLWDGLFSHLRQPIAQILLTRSDIADRSRYLNAQNTFNELLDMGVIPIVNENDTLAVSEIKFGDNDTLSAITAGMVHADLLFLMTDVDCLYDKNPRTNPDAQPIEVVEDIGQLVADVSTAGSSLGTGGMSTKIVAARLATSAGVTTVITRSSNPGNILSITRHVQASRSPASLATQENADDDHPLSKSVSSLHLASDTAVVPLHTRFLPSPHPIRDRSFWILHGLKPHGTIYIDSGAHRALLGKAGLLPVGVVDVDGVFAQQEAVSLCVVAHKRSSPDEHGRMWDGPVTEVGRALVNYSSTEIARVKGRQSTEIEGLLGYADSEYVAQRETIVFFTRESRPVTPTLGVGHGHGHGMTPGTMTPVREVLDGKWGIGGYEVGSGGGL